MALPARMREMLTGLVHHVGLTADTMSVELNRAALPHAAQDGEPIVLDVAVSIARRGVERRLVVDAAGGSARAPEDGLVRAVACGRAWFEELSTGKASSFTEIAERVGVSDRYVSRIVDLAFLAPDVVEAILAGDQRSGVTVKSLTVDRIIPLRWDDQRELLVTGRHS
jgi:site-specific DNA recombinase